MSFQRRSTLTVRIGSVAIGSAAPVAVQSMTNTDTADIEATVRQVRDLARAGSELVRITVNSAEAAAAVAPIRDRLRAAGVHVAMRFGNKMRIAPSVYNNQQDIDRLLNALS